MRRAVLALLACVGCDDAARRDPPEAPAACARATCVTGCCDADGLCRRDDDPQACGSDGRACQACDPDAACFGGTCSVFLPTREACTPSTCPGCCAGRRCVTSPTDTYCGAAASACVACPPWQACVDGGCVPDPERCGPHTCAGCCEDGLTCRPGTTGALCGHAGNLCEDCPESGYRACVDQRCVE